MQSFDNFLSQLPAYDQAAVRRESRLNISPGALTEIMDPIIYQTVLALLRRYHEWVQEAPLPDGD